jgi:hypothetical protein
MRAQVAQLLPDTCIIQQGANTPDGKGGFTESWSTLATVACRIDPMPRPVQPDTIGGREAILNQRMLTVPWDAPLAANRRVVIGTETYEVRDLHEDHSNRVSRRAIVTKVEGA